MIPTRDPTTMTPAERRAEVAFLLATGYLRLLIARKKALDLSIDVEALCAPVDGRKSASPEKESA